MDAFDRDRVKVAIKDSVIRVYQTQLEELDLYRNTLDCFSASIDALVQEITMEEWLIQERDRQIQKTKQNAIGSLHEDLMGSINGVDSLPVGNLVDIVCTDKKIVAEVKNKHNTTKGNHKVQIYRDLTSKLDGLDGYTGYYVEVLPKGAQRYNKPFTPSDNITKSKLPSRDDIRVIDGLSFYALLTGHDDAIEQIYRELPSIISEIIDEEGYGELDHKRITSSDLFDENFKRAFGD